VFIAKSISIVVGAIPETRHLDDQRRRRSSHAVTGTLKDLIEHLLNCAGTC